MEAILTALLAPPPLVEATRLDEFFAGARGALRGLSPIGAALVGGALADRLGFAFAAGYRGALAALVPAGADDEVASLCASEAGGAHPRAIATRLARGDAGWTLTGTKTFATLGHDATVLWVVASTGVEEGADGKPRNRLRLVRVRADAAGITRRRLPDTPFAPEIGHAEIVFAGTPVADADVQPGDGYERYLKPFRTVEDVHVHAAATGFVSGVAARHGWPRELRERLAAGAAALVALASADPSSPAVHVGVEGALATARRILDDAEPCWASVDPAARQRWERDRPLFAVAQRARTLRLEAAWRALEVSRGQPAESP